MKIQRSNSQIPTLIASVGPQDASSEERFRYASPKITNWRRVSSLTSVRTEGMSTISAGVEFSASERCLSRSRLSSVPSSPLQKFKEWNPKFNKQIGKTSIRWKKLGFLFHRLRRVSCLKSQQEKIRKSLRSGRFSEGPFWKKFPLDEDHCERRKSIFAPLPRRSPRREV